MSELEKKESAQYRRYRRCQITLLSIICITLALVSLWHALLFVQTKHNSHVNYTNEGKVIYRAYLAENDFFEQESLNGSHAYVASLIKYMTADFRYELKLDTPAEYRYSYAIDATLEIRDKKTNMAIYNPVFELVPSEEYTAQTDNLIVKRLVQFDYNEYNRIAGEFLRTYDLSDASAAIVVRMTVNVVGMHESFKENLDDAYMISVSVPLLQPTVTPSASTTVPTGETKIRIHDDGSLTVAKIMALGSGAAALILGCILARFIITTRDNFLDYSHKLHRIRTSYRSCIQTLNGDYTDDSCRWLEVTDFTELVAIRDTLQMPILMYENKEQLRTKFFIKNGDLVYCYILKMEK